MKSAFIAFALLAFTSTQAFASLIQNSDYDLEHQRAIVGAIQARCAMNLSTLVQISSTSETLYVDNGIRDIEYQTVIQSGSQKVLVTSFYADFQNPLAGSNYSIKALQSSDCRSFSNP